MDAIANKYRILKSLGQGAMGEVFLVLPPRGEPVALKLLKTLDEKAGKSASEQFENEFKVLKRLSHPNIGHIFDYGYDENLKKVFFTLPWLKGTDIYAATKDLSFDVVEDLFVQTLRALNYLHQKNLIHCDLKPGNVYVEDGKALLIDFGLAGYFGDYIVGTPTYLAPEIYQGARHNVLSDLYALGVIFYNCLTRTQPFSGKTLQEVFDRHRTLTPPPIHELNKKVPKYFGDIVAIMLNKKPEERFPSAAAVIEEIAAFSKKKYPIETEETLLSYLPTQSELVGRKDALLGIQGALAGFQSAENKKPYHVIFIHGRKNVGKSKVTAKIINDMQLAKVSVEKAIPPFSDSDRTILMSAKAVVLENLQSYLKTQSELTNLAEFTRLIEEKILSPETSRFLLVATSYEKFDFDGLARLFPVEATQFTEVELLPYTKEETKEFLINVIGQKEIPQTFVDQFYRNTDGLPDLATELIQSMIAKGLLFDKSGRWNEDLLTELDRAFDRLEVSESLEQEFEKLYATFTKAEEEIVDWLSLCPHGLTLTQLSNLVPEEDLKALLENMTAKNILKQEGESYTLYRQIFQDFIHQNLPDREVRRRHVRLAHPKTGLERKWAVYHLSLGDDKTLALRAAEKLAQMRESEGARDQAVETYKILLKDNTDQPLEKRLEWTLNLSSLLIWLDRFTEAKDHLDTIEKELQATKTSVNFEKFLTLIEKKGLALLHLHELDRAKVYFTNGLKSAEKDPKHLMHKLRFENDLAEIELIQNHHEAAIEIFLKTREEARKLSVDVIHHITNNDLGHVYVQRLEFDKAAPILAEDMKIFSQMHNQEPLARAVYSYARIMHAKNDLPRAIKSYEECARLCKRGHFFFLLLRTYNGLGNLYAAIQDFDQALNIYQKALDLSVRLGDLTTKGALLYNQGFIYRRQDNYALASRRFLLAIQVIENKEKKLPIDINMLSKCYGGLAVISTLENSSLKALSYFMERVKFLQLSQAPAEEEFGARLDLAEAYLKTRLNEKFLREVGELKKLAQLPEQLENLAKLEAEWKAVENFNTQDSTGRVQIVAVPN